MSKPPSKQAFLKQAHGLTFEIGRDGERLHRQLTSVYLLMADGMWRSLDMIWNTLGMREPQASISARLRDLRKIGFTVQRKYLCKGVWVYRLEAA